MKVGFVGTGAFTEVMVTGMLSEQPLASEVIISPATQMSRQNWRKNSRQCDEITSVKAD